MNPKIVVKLIKGVTATGVGFLCYISGKKNLGDIANKINKVGVRKTFMR